MPHQLARIVTFTIITACVWAFTAPVSAGFDPADVRTTTDFRSPMPFGTAGDGAIFPGKPYAGREVVEVRVWWDVAVADGHDAAAIKADVILPIVTDSGGLAGIILDGPALGWSGSGTFNHYEVTDRYNFSFGPVWTPWGWQSWGLPFDAVEVLPTSRIEIDYLAPEPSSGAALLLISAPALLRRRRRELTRQ